jgi:carboxyl-terminal processing protease
LRRCFSGGERLRENVVWKKRHALKSDHQRFFFSPAAKRRAFVFSAEIQRLHESLRILNTSCCILSKLWYYFAALKAKFRTVWVGVVTLAFCLAALPLTAATNLADLHISPGPEDGRIAYLTARLLEDLHFSHHRLDSEYGAEFLDFYVDSLDSQHLHFLQTDLDEFQSFRTNLYRLTINRRLERADVTPAFAVFGRFIQRLNERITYSEDLLKHENFSFDKDEKILVSRKDAPFPKNMAEAKDLWRQQVKFQYLQEKLGLEDARKKAAPTNSVKSIHEQIVETLTHRYQRMAHVFTDWNNQDVMGVYLTALSHVYDPHSDYFDQTQLSQFQINMNLALFGIGAQLQQTEEGYCKIAQLLPGGPAEKSKALKVGDRIVAVAQSNQPPTDIVEMNLNKAVQLIRGPKGTEVRLTVVPEHESSPRTIISLVRDEIPLADSAAKGKIIEFPSNSGETNRLGVIDLPSFYAPMGPVSRSSKETSGEYTSVDVAKLLTKFKREGVHGVVLDLRRNGGGSLDEAIKLTGLFIKDGPVVQVKAYDGRQIVAEDPDHSCLYDGPLIVLTSRFSASASEIVAAALQDYGRAIIVGDSSTHGKGTVQSVNYLTNFPIHFDTDPGALKVTVQKFYRVTGVSTQLKGVTPDIVLPSRWNYSKDVGESALEHPLECDMIGNADYDKLNLVQPFLPELKQRSEQRVAKSQDFVWEREDIEEFKKRQEDKSISLNEKQRRKEVEENDAREKARDKQRKSRKEPAEKIYTITLKQADLPGLPAPDQKTNSFTMQTTSTGSGTNVASTASATTTKTTLDVDEEKTPGADANLDEAERILQDYINALQKRAMLTVQ